MKKNIASFFIAIIIIFSLCFISSGKDYGIQIVRAEINGTNQNTNYLNEIIVKYRNNKKTKLVQVKNDIDKEIHELNRQNDIEFAEPNYIYRSAIIPSDIYYNNQWYLKKIKAPEAWNIIRESEDIVIAIIDSGVQINHPDLKDNIWRNEKEIPDNGIDDDKNGFIDDVNGWDFVNNVADPNPKFNDDYNRDGIIHGTVVAGIAGAFGNNGTGVTGVSWQVKLMPLKVLNDSGEGDTQKVVQAVDYAVKNGADILNFSFVGSGYSQALDNAIRRAHNSGILVVAAAGNDEGEGSGINIDSTPLYPACHDGAKNENMVIGVGATDTLDQKAVFSSFGHNCVDIVAPGVSIYSTTVFSAGREIDGTLLDKYYDGYWSGTSMATPMVSASLALLEKLNPALSPSGLKAALLNTTDNINRLNPEYINLLGRGRLNLFQAVNTTKELLGNGEVKLLVSPIEDYEPEIKILGLKGESSGNFFAYNKGFRGGVNVAAGDVNGDGKDEIITGAGFGGGPHVRIFDENGNVLHQFFAYNKGFRGGVNVAAGDVNGDGKDEIITGAGFGGGPHVRIFDENGNVLHQFFAYNKGFRGGVNVAAGDVNGDGKDEIITGAGVGGGPQVRIFTNKAKVLGQFFAYDKNFRGGVKVATARLHAGARGVKMDIVTAPGFGGGPHIRIFDSHASIIGQFFAYDKNFRGGVSIATADIDSDGLDEIITGAGKGGSPHVRTFETNGELKNSFFADFEDYIGGINVNSIYIVD